MPIPTNLTTETESGLGDWKHTDFTALLRTGKRPDGTQVDPMMPWSTYQYMNDTEIAVLWAYLRTLPARPFGGR